MRNIGAFIISAALVAAAATLAFPAADAWAIEAGANRTFVSGQGTDSGTCPVTAPCRSFAYALTQTAPGGEITVLDSAGYGPVTIAQSLTITNPGGVEAGVTATSGTNAITIEPTSQANITLRGLTLEGGGAGVNGVDIIPTFAISNTPSTINLIGCVIKDFTNTGVRSAMSVTGSTSGTPVLLNILIADSFVLNNAGTGIDLMNNNAAEVNVDIEHAIASYNNIGITLDSINGVIAANLVDIRANSNVLNGVNVTNGSTILKHSVVEDSNTSNDVVLNANGASLIDHNLIGTLDNGGIASSDGTNYIARPTGNTIVKVNPQ